FEHEWLRAPVAVRARPPRASRAATQPPVPSERAVDAATAAPSTEQTNGPAPTPGSTQGAGKPSATSPSKSAATPASASAAEADDVPCRRSCSLRYRACLARCRDQPIRGGKYDAGPYD